MRQKILLIEDVDSLGRSGEIVSVRAGYARNYILPKKKGVIADKHTLRMQNKLQEERSKQALADKSRSEEISKQVQDMELSIKVKVDPEGRMYGSVSAADISKLLSDAGYEIDKKYILLRRPIKEIGDHDITLRMQEGVEASIKLKIMPEGTEETTNKKKEEKKQEEA